MAYNHESKLVYIPVQLNSFIYGHDPATQEKAWEVPRPAFSVNSGLLTTAGGLVFQGTADGKFFAHDMDDGSTLWEYDLGAGIIAPPVTYVMDGKQYISIAVGWGGGIPALWSKATDQLRPGTIFTFALGEDSTRTYRGFPEVKPASLIDLAFTATANEIRRGKKIYTTQCVRCHGHMGMNGGSIPNLAYSDERVYTFMDEIVLDGLYLQKGMPGFSGRLATHDIDLVKKYLLHSVESLRRSD